MAESGSRAGRVIVNTLNELGLITMWNSSRDVKFLCAQRFVRLFAYGGSTLILVSYLSAIGIPDDRIGLFMTLTLVGDVVISFFLTLFADAMGRKAVLALGSLLMAASGIVFALTGNYWILLAAAVFGVISPRYVPRIEPPNRPLQNYCEGKYTQCIPICNGHANFFIVEMKLAHSVQ